MNRRIPILILLGMGCLFPALACEWKSPAAPSTVSTAETSTVNFEWRAHNDDLWVLSSRYTQNIGIEKPDGTLEPLNRYNNTLRMTIQVRKVDANGVPTQLRLHIDTNESEPLQWKPASNGGKGEWQALGEAPLQLVPNAGAHLDVEWNPTRGHWASQELGVNQDEWLNAMGGLRKRLLSRFLRPEIPTGVIKKGETQAASTRTWQKHVASMFGSEGKYSNSVTLEELQQKRNDVDYWVLDFAEELSGSPPAEMGFTGDATTTAIGSGEIHVATLPSFRYWLELDQRMESRGPWLRVKGSIDQVAEERTMITSTKVEERFSPADAVVPE